MIARLAFAALTLASCAQTREPVDPVTGQPSACHADAARALVGKPFTDARAAETLRLTGMKQYRRVAPGMMVTMDYRGGRLNIDTDDKGVITRIYCG